MVRQVLDLRLKEPVDEVLPCVGRDEVSEGVVGLSFATVIFGWVYGRCEQSRNSWGHKGVGTHR